MERKDFLRNSLGLMGAGVIILDACSKSSDSSTSTTTTTGSCTVSPEETEGPYPYPSGEINNPLNRAVITESKTGIPLSLTFNVVNTNSNCAAIANARVDIWHCDKDGYYSGYANQPGYLGTQSYVGSTFLRGYVLADSAGQAKFTTIYPGWYTGRATHIHIEVYINNVLKKTTQVAFSETVSDAVHTSSLYTAHGVNTTRNAADTVFSDSLASELLTLTGSISAGYTGTYTIGIAL